MTLFCATKIKLWSSLTHREPNPTPYLEYKFQILKGLEYWRTMCSCWTLLLMPGKAATPTCPLNLLRPVLGTHTVFSVKEHLEINWVIPHLLKRSKILQQLCQLANSCKIFLINCDNISFYCTFIRKFILQINYKVLF